MNVKKIKAEQFVLNCINKMFEIVGSELQWYSFEKLSLWNQELADKGQRFFELYSMSLEQYLEFRDYFFEHYYDWRPKRVSHCEVEKEFSIFMFQYGFPYDFKETSDDIPKYKWNKKIN